MKASNYVGFHLKITHPLKPTNCPINQSNLPSPLTLFEISHWLLHLALHCLDASNLNCKRYRGSHLWQTQLQMKLNCFTFLPSLFHETDAKATRWKRWIIILMTFLRNGALFLLFFLPDFMIRLCWFMLIARNWSFWLFSRFLWKKISLNDDEVVGRSEMSAERMKNDLTL